ncbi:hypothetical protein ACFSVK_06480 [Azorhizophilus paspali]|uniref:hypothetical protein n=1 Tax=Azorhizophilus paspali TaxID=69963 RepID=UPI003642B053
MRNLRTDVKTAHDKWAVATAINTSGVVLEEPIVIIELPDGTEVRHVGPARVEPGDAWRIVEPIPGSTGLKLGGRR